MILTNGRVITQDKNNPYIENGAVVIKKEKIVAVGKAEEILKNYSDDEIIDVENKVIMPGIINAHKAFTPHPAVVRRCLMRR